MSDPLHARIFEIAREEFAKTQSGARACDSIATRILSALAESGADGRIERALAIARPVLNWLRSVVATIDTCPVERQAAQAAFDEVGKVVEILSAPNPSNSSNSSQPAEKADCPECQNAISGRVGITTGNPATLDCANCGKRHEQKREEPAAPWPVVFACPFCESDLIDGLRVKDTGGYLRCRNCGAFTIITDGLVRGWDLPLREHPDTVALRELREAIDHYFPDSKWPFPGEHRLRLSSVANKLELARIREGDAKKVPSPPEPPRQTIRQADPLVAPVRGEVRHWQWAHDSMTEARSLHGKGEYAAAFEYLLDAVNWLTNAHKRQVDVLDEREGRREG